MYDLFFEEDCMLNLINFVLENYSPKETVIMTDLISKYFTKYKDWLESIKNIIDKE
jgi:peptidyl-tRNA hydrolase